MVQGCTNKFSSGDSKKVTSVESSNLDTSLSDWLGEPIVLAGFIAIWFVLMIAFGALTAWLQAGYFKGVKSVMQGRQVAFGDMYDNSANWLVTFLAEILRLAIHAVGLTSVAFIIFAAGAILGPAGATAGIIVGLVVFLPLFLYFWLGTTFMKHAAALDGLGPMNAFLRSWSLADGKRLELFMIHVVQFALALASIMLCCVGLIGMGILVEIMWAEAYIKATDDGRLNPTNPPGGTEPPEDRHAEVVTPTREETAQQPGEPGAFDPGAWRKDLDDPNAPNG